MEDPQLPLWELRSEIDFGDTPEDTIATRRDRGAEIWSSGGVTPADRPATWKVASQSVPGAIYTVRRVLARLSCNCPDFIENQGRCKHIYAVEHFVSRGTPESTVALKNTRPQRARQWGAYNKAKATAESRVAQILASLVSVIDEPLPQRGNQHAHPAELLFSAVMKIYAGESGRDYYGDLQTRWVDNGYLSQTYHFNTLSKFMREMTTTLLLREFIRETSRPLQALACAKRLAIDSTGMAARSSSIWYDVKYERTRKRDFLKLHIAVDTTTHIVTDAIVTDDKGSDSKAFIPLLEGTLIRYQPSELSADKAYAGLANYQAAEAANVLPLIPPRGNMTGKGSLLMERMFHAFRSEDTKVLARYHARSNVESTMFMIKQQFGDSITSRSTVGQTNEILAKVLCHNMHCLVMACALFGLTDKLLDRQQCAC